MDISGLSVDYQWMGWANILGTPSTTMHKNLERPPLTSLILRQDWGPQMLFMLLPVYQVSV